MKTVNVTDEGAIRVVEMDRPEALNAFSNQLMDELTDAFQAAAGDDAIKVVVLTGAGRAFSAGADLQEMGRPGGAKPRHGFAGLLDTLIDFPKPFFVAVDDDSVRQAELVAPSKTKRGISGRMDKAILKAMSLDPNRRHASAMQLSFDLDRCVPRRLRRHKIGEY